MAAVLKAGGAYVPLDPGYPAERLAFRSPRTRTCGFRSPEARGRCGPVRGAADTGGGGAGGIWAEMLGVRLLARIQATFNQEISIRIVFSMPTLEALAGEIERRIYEKVATMSDFEVEQLAGSNPFAGA